MLGLGSYTFRWSAGHKGVVPEVPMSHSDMLKVAAKHGLGLVQFADNIPVDVLAPEEMRALADEARDLGIEIELGTQAFVYDQMCAYIGYCDIFGAKILRVALDGPDAEIPVPDLAQSFRKLLPIAEAANLCIAVENHFNYPAPRLARLMEEINDPRVGVCLDVANSICAGEWPMETVQTLAAYAINLHLKDYDIVPDPLGVGFAIYGTPLGQGRTDCRAVLEALPKDREINVILEHWLPLTDGLDAACAAEHVWLAQSVSFARNELGI
ncbi:sugar phosphate isomerase/epimerase family protein [Thalassospira alkalitolerans]|uniref:sugar phosphate isomerase/epimerase family protein n=1 Tax=Thalassospira alkalitolerans TaxID=1293890 RepID=UPI003AA90854